MVAAQQPNIDLLEKISLDPSGYPPRISTPLGHSYCRRAHLQSQL